MFKLPNYIMKGWPIHVYKTIGKQTAQLASPPTITETFSVVGSKEGAGPLRTYFDEIVEDNTFGEDSWEKAESKFMSTAIQKVVQKLRFPQAIFSTY